MKIKNSIRNVIILIMNVVFVSLGISSGSPGVMPICNMDTFPAFALQTLHIGLPLRISDSIYCIPDPQNEICDSLLIYTITGSVPDDSAGWLMDDELGTLDAQSVNTPMSSLCKLLSAYKTGNLDTIRAQYSPDVAPVLNEMFSDSLITQSFLQYTESIVNMRFLMGAVINASDSGYMAWVRLNIGSSASEPIPYFMKKINATWMISSTIDTLSWSNSLAIALKFKAASTLQIGQDIDNDGINNVSDNCPCVSNHSQKDYDADGIGDACDNCILIPNHDQSDRDLDGNADVCDNCPLYPNPEQEDVDNDFVGDSCDNCLTVNNPGQEDQDHDFIGDACDIDINGDGVPNANDPDMDGDGILNNDDNCPAFYNPMQKDSDEDSKGDGCDNCPLFFNPIQENMDYDGMGDQCDPDRDGDHILNVYDNCPNNYNPGQEDTDCDGIGDVCE